MANLENLVVKKRIVNTSSDSLLIREIDPPFQRIDQSISFSTNNNKISKLDLKYEV